MLYYCLITFLTFLQARFFIRPSLEEVRDQRTQRTFILDAPLIQSLKQQAAMQHENNNEPSQLPSTSSVLSARVRTGLQVLKHCHLRELWMLLALQNFKFMRVISDGGLISMKGDGEFVLVGG